MPVLVLLFFASLACLGFYVDHADPDEGEEAFFGKVTMAVLLIDAFFILLILVK